MNIGKLIQQVGENLQFVLICVLVVAVLTGLSRAAEHTVLRRSIVQISRTKYVVLCGMLGALACVLHVLDFPVIFLAPEFYKLDFSELPVMIGGFFLGPVGAVIIELLKILLKLLLKGTSTAFVGDLANFIIGCALVVPASVLYHLKKTKKCAIVSLIAGTFVMALFGTIFNAVYLLPAFSDLYGLPLETIVSMGSAINKKIDSVVTLALFSVFPLNLLKGGVVSVLTMLIYKRISIVLHNQMLEGNVQKQVGAWEK